MRFAWLLRFLLLFFAVFALNAQALPWKKTEAVKAELISQATSVQPGSSIRLGVLLTQEPGWHTYWKTPGDTGLSTTIDWTLPEGWKAGQIQWPTPNLYVVGDLTNFGYEGLCSSARFNFRSRICQGRRLRRKSECLLVNVRGTMHSGKCFVRRSR